MGDGQTTVAAISRPQQGRVSKARRIQAPVRFSALLGSRTTAPESERGAPKPTVVTAFEAQ